MPNLLVADNQVEYEQTGAGQDLILLPTLLAEMTVYDEVIDYLSGQFRVTRINFPGFGSSLGPIGQTIESYAYSLKNQVNNRKNWEPRFPTKTKRKSKKL